MHPSTMRHSDTPAHDAYLQALHEHEAIEDAQAARWYELNQERLLLADETNQAWRAEVEAEIGKELTDRDWLEHVADEMVARAEARDEDLIWKRGC